MGAFILIVWGSILVLKPNLFVRGIWNARTLLSGYFRRRDTWFIHGRLDYYSFSQDLFGLP